MNDPDKDGCGPALIFVPIEDLLTADIALAGDWVLTKEVKFQRMVDEIRRLRAIASSSTAEDTPRQDSIPVTHAGRTMVLPADTPVAVLDTLASLAEIYDLDSPDLAAFVTAAEGS